MRALRHLVEWRRDLVQDRTRLTNRITDALKAYFPQILEWFQDKEAAIFADFLERWPALQDAQRARSETLKTFFHAGNVRRAATIETRIKAIAEERSLHSDAGVTGPARLLVEALLLQLRVLSAGIGRFEAEIARLAPQQADYELFRDLPGAGAGPTFAPRLLVAFGERRSASRPCERGFKATDCRAFGPTSHAATRQPSRRPERDPCAVHTLDRPAFSGYGRALTPRLRSAAPGREPAIASGLRADPKEPRNCRGCRLRQRESHKRGNATLGQLVHDLAGSGTARQRDGDPRLSPRKGTSDTRGTRPVASRIVQVRKGGESARVKGKRFERQRHP